MSDDPPPNDRARDPERLLDAIEELRTLERRKRALSPSSEPFRDLARQVEDKAREIFRLADHTDEIDEAEADAERTDDDSAHGDERGGPWR